MWFRHHPVTSDGQIKEISRVWRKARGESVPAENSVDSFFVKGSRRPAGFSPNDFITPRDGCESNFNCFKFRDRLTPAFFFFFFDRAIGTCGLSEW